MGHDPELTATRFGLNKGKHMKPLESPFLNNDGPDALLSPDPPDYGFESNAPFIFGPEFNGLARMILTELGYRLRDFFLNCSCSSWLAASLWRGRGTCWLYPSRFRYFQPVTLETFR